MMPSPAIIVVSTEGQPPEVISRSQPGLAGLIDWVALAPTPY
jgi:hypothetical protein